MLTSDDAFISIGLPKILPHLTHPFFFTLPKFTETLLIFLLNMTLNRKENCLMILHSDPGRALLLCLRNYCMQHSDSELTDFM